MLLAFFLVVLGLVFNALPARNPGSRLALPTLALAALSMTIAWLEVPALAQEVTVEPGVLDGFISQLNGTIVAVVSAVAAVGGLFAYVRKLRKPTL